MMKNRNKLGLYLLSNYHKIRPSKEFTDKANKVRKLKDDVKFLQSKRWNLLVKR